MTSAPAGQKLVVTINTEGAAGRSIGGVRVTLPTYDFYSSLLGRHPEDVSVGLALLTGSLAHHLAATMACNQAMGLGAAAAGVRTGRMMALCGFVLQRHGLHLLSCAEAPGFFEDALAAGPAVQESMKLATFGGRFLGLSSNVDVSSAEDVGEMPKVSSFDLFEVRSCALGLIRAFGTIRLPHIMTDEKVTWCGDSWINPIRGGTDEGPGLLNGKCRQLDDGWLVGVGGDRAAVGPLARLHRLFDMPFKALPIHLREARRDLNHVVPPLFAGGDGSGDRWPDDPVRLFVGEAAEAVVLIDTLEAMANGRWSGGPELSVSAGTGASGGRQREGWSLVEAPCGVLMHHVAFDGSGRLCRGSVHLPSHQNLCRLEWTAAQMADQMSSDGKSRSEIESGLTFLIRAFNPCTDQSGDFVEYRWL